MYYPFGLFGRGAVLAAMFVMAYGAMVAYLIIIKDTVPTIIGYDEGFQRELVLIITSLLIMLPVSLQRDVASLSITSLISVTADILLVLFILMNSPFMDTRSEIGGFGELWEANSFNPNFFVGLGIISDAMCCQHSSFLVYGSLKNSSELRWSIVSAVSIASTTVLGLITGVSGYLGFLEETQGDVLNNFPDGSFVANVARGLLALSVFFTYPVESFVGRHVLIDLVHNRDYNDGPEHEQSRLDVILFNRRGRMTIAMYILALIPALIFDDLGPVLSITGSLGGSFLAYIGPGLAFLGK